MFRKITSFLVALVALAGTATPLAFSEGAPGKKERHLLYVAVPGIRNYLEFGGAGILVFDMDAGHKFVRRIATPASKADSPENIKGVCASAVTKKLYFTTLKKLYCVDLATDKTARSFMSPRWSGITGTSSMPPQERSARP
jgi:hypothetical protein